jgi:hypothetical protein
MTDSQIQRASAGACCRTTPHEGGPVPPLPTARSRRVSTRLTVLCLSQSIPPNTSTARAHARTQASPPSTTTIPEEWECRRRSPSSSLVLPGQDALYRMGNGERPHRCPPRPTASASTRVRIAPLPHTSSALRKWRIRQRSAAEGGGQWGVVDWKDRCRTAPRAASGENVEVSL